MTSEEINRLKEAVSFYERAKQFKLMNKVYKMLRVFTKH